MASQGKIQEEKVLQLLHSEDERNIRLALSICEGGDYSEAFLKKISHHPRWVLISLELGLHKLLSHFKHLYLRRLKLNTLSDHARSLKNVLLLDLAYNELREIPEVIFELKSLKKLRLHHNLISHIPDTIIQLENLEELRLDQNQLTSLPDVLGKLPNLKKLAFIENPMPPSKIESYKQTFRASNSRLYMMYPNEYS